jgi:drug/metabolite transporter (DMT)-like permease
MILVVVLVLIAASANAAALVMLRKAALSEPAAPSFSLNQLWALLHRRLWAAGIATLFAASTLQATALSIGAVAQVQLIIILELPFTLVLSSIVLGGPLKTREWTAIAAMTVGVALLLYMLEPRGGDPYSTNLTVWIIAATLTVALIAALVLLGRRRDGAAKSMLFGVATGATSGLIAVLTSAVLTAAAAGGIIGVFTTWWTYLLILTVPLGFLLLQNALHAGRLVASQPGITLANPLVAAVWGIGIFGEDVRTGAWLVGAAAGIALIATGVVLLSRSSLLQRMQLQPA